MIDMAVLIAQNKPDPDGNVIPSNIEEGSVMLANAQEPAKPLTLVVDLAVYNVANATCCGQCTNCCGPSSFTITPGNFSMAVGQQMQCTCTETDCTGAKFTASGTWSSSNTSVMSVGSSSGIVTGVSPGTGTITVDLGFMGVGSGCIPNGCPTGRPTPSTGGTVCDFSISPAAVSNAFCDGTKNNTNYTPNISPSISACAFQPSQSSCNWTVVSGAIDSAGNVNNLSAISPYCTAQYFAGPGTSGAHVGTVQWSMSLRLGQTTVTHTQKAPVSCK